MRAPAFQCYADDLIAGTIQFSDAELGLYMRLLCVQWSTGSLPDDDEELRSYGKGDTPIARVKAKFKKCEDGRLRNERMEKERQKQQDYRDRQRVNGALGGRPKGLGYSGETQTKPKKTSPSPSPSPSPVSGTVSGSAPSTPISPFDRFWSAYPRRTAKAAAERAWKRAKGDTRIEEILKAIEAQKKTHAWKKNNGEFIPHPATWLNQGRWQDEVKGEHGTRQQGNRNGSRPVTGAEQRQLGIPESTGPNLSELIRRKRQSGHEMATPPDRVGDDHAGSSGNGHGDASVVPPGP